MQQDAKTGKIRSREEYLEVYCEAGGPCETNAANVVVNREAKRIFGRPLGRGRSKRASKAAGASGRRGGRPASPALIALRAKLQADKAGTGLRKPTDYVRWMIDQPGAKMGLKQARPIVYRELRVARAS